MNKLLWLFVFTILNGVIALGSSSLRSQQEEPDLWVGPTQEFAEEENYEEEDNKDEWVMPKIVRDAIANRTATNKERHLQNNMGMTIYDFVLAKVDASKPYAQAGLYSDVAVLLLVCDSISNNWFRGILDNPRNRYTLFVPRNNAFKVLTNQIGEEMVENLVETQEICNVLQRHVIRGTRFFPRQNSRYNVQAGPFRNAVGDGTIKMETTRNGNRQIIKTGRLERALWNNLNIRVQNGAIHVMKQVILY